CGGRRWVWGARCGSLDHAEPTPSRWMVDRSIAGLSNMCNQLQVRDSRKLPFLRAIARASKQTHRLTSKRTDRQAGEHTGVLGLLLAFPSLIKASRFERFQSADDLSLMSR